MRLGSGIVVAVVQAGSCSSYSTPSLGTSHATDVAIKKKKKKKRKKNFFFTTQVVFLLMQLKFMLINMKYVNMKIYKPF